MVILAVCTTPILLRTLGLKNILNLFEIEEQAGKAIVPSQAVPLFSVKFSKLISFLRRSIEASAHLSVVDKYILVRYAACFVVDFFTGDRASDLKDRKGFLFKFTLTKTFGVKHLVLLS